MTPEQTALLQAQELIFTEVEVEQTLAQTNSFDPSYLDYYNFLEGIVRVCKARPWTEEEEAAMPHFDEKLNKICNLLEDTYYEELSQIFAQQREAF